MSARGTAVVLRVRVIPRARSNALTRDPSGTLRARLTAPPVDGAANRALVDLLARELGLKRADFTVVRGAHGRDKLVTVRGCSEAELAERVRRLGAADVDNVGRGG